MDISRDPGVQLGEAYQGGLYQTPEGFRGLTTEPMRDPFEQIYRER